MTDKIFILSFGNKEDRQNISKIFKSYQSLVYNLYFDFPLVELKTKKNINYVNLIKN